MTRSSLTRARCPHGISKSALSASTAKFRSGHHGLVALHAARAVRAPSPPSPSTAAPLAQLLLTPNHAVAWTVSPVNGPVALSPVVALTSLAPSPQLRSAEAISAARSISLVVKHLAPLTVSTARGIPGVVALPRAVVGRSHAPVRFWSRRSTTATPAAPIPCRLNLATLSHALSTAASQSGQAGAAVRHARRPAREPSSCSPSTVARLVPRQQSLSTAALQTVRPAAGAHAVCPAAAATRRAA